VIDRLKAFLAGKLERVEDITVTNLRRHTEGFSLETFSFDASWRSGGTSHSQRYVIRREPPAGLLEPYDLEPQFRVLEAIADTPVRFPRVFWYEPDPAVLGAPFYVMEWVDGDVPIPALDADGNPPFSDERERRSLGRDYATILAQIHRVDWRANGLDFLGVPRDGRDAAERAVDFWHGYAERSRLAPMPMMTEAFCWLRRNLPHDAPIALLHGDYRTGNFLAREGRITAFLDWELVHLGDPMEDIGWSSCRLWRGDSPYVGYLLTREEFAQWYQEAGGFDVDPTRVHFYEVLACVKMAAIMLTGVKAWNDGRTTDMRMSFFDQQVAGMYASIAEALGIISLP